MVIRTSNAHKRMPFKFGAFGFERTLARPSCAGCDAQLGSAQMCLGGSQPALLVNRQFNADNQSTGLPVIE
jgi:hypothetical protein